MKVQLHENFTAKDVVIVPLFEKEFKGALPQQLEKILPVLVKQMERTEKKVASVNAFEQSLELVVGVDFGNPSKLSVEDIRRKVATALKPAKALQLKEITFVHPSLEEISAVDFFKGIVEGLHFASYSFKNYKQKDNTYNVEELIYSGIGSDLLDVLHEQAQESENIAIGHGIARDLVNEPANIVYPKSLAKRVEKLGEKYDFDVEVMKEQEIDKLGMKAFMEVAKGSKNGPRLIVMRYFGASEEDKVLGLVGKGLTYDSGGYSIKPTNGMLNMKTDMGGAAAVIGAMVSIAKAKLPVNVVSVVAACENMISDRAYKPGDVIGSMEGKTILIENTDAEGRLTLIDAVYYARTVEGVDEIVDIATLTGAQGIALGSERAGAVSNNDDFYKAVEEASDISGEKIWRLPNDDAYKKLLETSIADLRNIGGREAGTITAGLFIGAFVDDTPWVHLDIATPSYVSKEQYYYEAGATGFGSRTLYELAKSR